MSMDKFKPRAAAIALALAALLPTTAVPAAADDAAAVNTRTAAQLAAEICSGCHGPAGVGRSPLFPRLAAQQEAYLSAQLHAFSRQARSDPGAHNYMWGMASLITDETADAFARYYASQPPAPGIPGDAWQVVEGRELFEQGLPARGIPACISCHGANAEGRGIFPRLAGQQSAYVVRRLQAIQNQPRTSAAGHRIIEDLKLGEMQAIAAYVQSK